MNINLMFLILQGVSGGASGYITNKYAVNMLFKEYTPLKLGGVIRKNKQKFIEELSELIERDIINGETLKEKVSTEEFKNQLKKMNSSILKENLKESLNDLRIKDISNFYDSKDSLKHFIKDNLEILTTDFIENFLNNFKIEYVLSKEQKDNISSNVYNLLLKHIEKEENIVQTVCDLYEEKSNIKISELLCDDTKNKIIQEIEKYIELIFKDIFENEEKLKMSLNKLYEILNIQDIVCKLQELIKEKELRVFIDEEKTDNFINSDYLKTLLKSIIDKIYEKFMNSDKYMYEILPEETNAILESVMKTALEKMIPYLSGYIAYNKEEINRLIEESINESMYGFDASIKNLIINKARETFLTDNSSKPNAVNKIIEYIESYLMNKDSSKDISTYIMNYFKYIKVSDILKNLDKKTICENLLENKNIIVKFIINPLLSKKVKDVINFDLKELLNTNGSEYIYNFIFKNKAVFSKKISQILCKSINSKVIEFYDTDLKSIAFIKSNILEKSSEYIFNLFKENEENIKKCINNKLNISINQMNLKEEFSNHKNFIENIFIQKVLNVEEEIISKYEENKLIDIIENINNKEEIIDELNDKVFICINKNLNTLINEKVKKIVYDNLIRLNEDEICDLAQEFMGNELKPLSVFGGILGGITGLIFGMFTNNINVSGFYNTGFETIISCLLMGIIGIMTNVIALKMLFHPYKKNKFLAKIPFLKQFALGYIPAHRESMANSIGNVIENNLLNPDKVKSLFAGKKDHAKKSLINNIEDSNYKILTKFIATKKENISSSLYKKVLSILKNKKTCNDLSRGIKNIKINKIIKKTYLDNLVAEFIKQKDFIGNHMIKHIESKIKKEEKIKNILNNETLLKIEKFIENEINLNVKNQMISLIKTEFIKDFVSSNHEDYFEFMNKNIKELLSEEICQEINKFFEYRIEKFIKEDSKLIINDATYMYLIKELSDENTFGNIFDSNIRLMINKNLYSIIKNLNEKLIEYLNDNKDEISLLVKNIISNQLNFLEKGLFFMAGGNNIVEEAVNIMISKKLRVFIDNKTYETISVIENGLNNSLYLTQMIEFNIKSYNVNLSNMVDFISCRINDMDFIKEKQSISQFLVKYICGIKVNDIKVFINKNFVKEIDMIQYEISRNINNNLDEVSHCITHIFKDNILKYIYDADMKEIYENINMQNTIKNIISNILESNSVKNNTITIINDIYTNNFDLKIKNFIDEDILSIDLNEIIKYILENDEFNKENIRLINIIIENLIENNIKFINNNTKKDITEHFVEAFIFGVLDHTNNILKSVRLKDVTEKQISVMNSKDIHMLFDSFAGDFFKKLYLYGSFGAVFGFNMYLSIILVIINAIPKKSKN